MDLDPSEDVAAGSRFEWNGSFNGAGESPECCGTAGPLSDHDPQVCRFLPDLIDLV